MQIFGRAARLYTFWAQEDLFEIVATDDESSSAGMKISNRLLQAIYF